MILKKKTLKTLLMSLLMALVMILTLSAFVVTSDTVACRLLFSFASRVFSVYVAGTSLDNFMNIDTRRELSISFCGAFASRVFLFKLIPTCCFSVLRSDSILKITVMIFVLLISVGSVSVQLIGKFSSEFELSSSRIFSEWGSWIILPSNRRYVLLF